MEDAAGNLMVYLDAAPGYESKASMLLQSFWEFLTALLRAMCEEA